MDDHTSPPDVSLPSAPVRPVAALAMVIALLVVRTVPVALTPGFARS